ncbi:MAG: hypothetical protein JWL63_1542 [Rhodocyclales bacterium]|nr:hypothetical protein [Rhodocyclales bacterium]
MAKNLILSLKTSQDIDRRVERILKGLGDPEPPLRLEEVRELLKLDRAFYTADDPGIISESISRIRVAGLQIFKRPSLLKDAIKKWSLKALYLPDSKRILLDSDLPILKHRWNEAHEVGHSIIPWHEEFMHGDNTHTISADCSDHIEAEANYAAGRLLFLRDRFVEEALSVTANLKSVQALHKTYGNTFSTTLYRYIECAGLEVPFVGMITGHPHANRRGPDFNPAKPCKHFVRSQAFANRFSKLSEIDLFTLVARYCGSQRGGPLGFDEIVLADDNGDRHRFSFETFFNRYDGLTLGVYLGPQETRIIFSTF